MIASAIDPANQFMLLAVSFCSVCLCSVGKCLNKLAALSRYVWRFTSEIVRLYTFLIIIIISLCNVIIIKWHVHVEVIRLNQECTYPTNITWNTSAKKIISRTRLIRKITRLKLQSSRELCLIVFNPRLNLHLNFLSMPEYLSQSSNQSLQSHQILPTKNVHHAL